MTKREYEQIRALTAEIGPRIQPLLQPCEGLTKRNAFAHIWLGVRTRFGEGWREVALAEEVAGFVRWIGNNPNADYSDFRGGITHVSDRRATEPSLFSFNSAQYSSDGLAKLAVRGRLHR
ncbi:MAG: hypothetical protein EXS03_06350 [Phycisphaerales bacterium]|nr:hypothetical protein [Phycisphaerales bacterium]